MNSASIGVDFPLVSSLHNHLHGSAVSKFQTFSSTSSAHLQSSALSNMSLIHLIHARGKENCPQAPSCRGTVERGVCWCSKVVVGAKNDDSKPPSRSAYHLESGSTRTPKVRHFFLGPLNCIVLDELTGTIV